MKKKILSLVLGAVLFAVGYRIAWFYLFGQIMQPEAIYAVTVHTIAIQARDDLYFLQINGQDPSPSLLQRFKGESFLVRKASEGKQFSHVRSLGQTVDLRTGQTGTVINLQGIKWQEAMFEVMPSRSKYPAAVISLKNFDMKAGAALCIGPTFQMVYVDGHWKQEGQSIICTN